MTSTLEWSLEFDQMYNNITSNQAPGLTEHEKSIFLTRAQEALVKDYFSGKTNILGEGFDESERRQADFSMLVQIKDLTDYSSTLSMPRMDMRGISKVYQYPEDILLTINEQLEYKYAIAGSSPTEYEYVYYQIVPISYGEYRRLMLKPYKYPPKGMAWRLLTGSYTVGTGPSAVDIQRAEVIARFPATTPTSLRYIMRYVRNPKPIVLPDEQGVDEDAELTVDGVDTPSICELPEHLHDEILQRAVLLAKLAWSDAVAPQAKTQ